MPLRRAGGHHSSPRLGSGSGYFFGQPSHRVFLFHLSPRPGARSPSKPNQSANKFRWESSKIPLQFSLSSTLGGVPTSLGKQEGCGGRGGGRRVRLSMLLSHQAGWLHLREAGAGGGEAGGNSPSPQTHSGSCLPHSAEWGTRGRNLSSPGLTGSYRPLGLDFCACAMCLGGEATDPGPPLTLFLFFKVEHHTGPGTPEWVQAAGSLSHRSPGDR